MAKPITLAVIFGGRSQEHEVSIVSATKTVEALADKKKYRVVPIGITKDGAWYVGENILKQFKNRTTAGLHPAAFALDNSGDILVFKDRGEVERIKIDVAFPLVLGPHGEDGALPGLLEMVNVPYVGDGVFASSCAFDKAMTKAQLAAAGIPQVPYVAFEGCDWQEQQGQLVRRIKRLGLPCFVKPARCGSSIGVAKVKAVQQLIPAVHEALRYDDTIVVEAGVPHVVEVECSVIGNNTVTASIPGEIHYDGEFYDYNAKYVSKKWDISIPPRLSKKIIAQVRSLAAQAFRAIGGSGLARVDFLVNKATGKIYLNEINTVPSFRPEGVYVRLLKNVGYTFPKVIDTLVSLAIERHRQRSGTTLTFEPEHDWFKTA